MYDKPIPISVEGMDIRTTVIDEVDDVVKISQNINIELFLAFARKHENHRGWVTIEIVKRKTPSSKGHNYWARVALYNKGK